MIANPDLIRSSRKLRALLRRVNAMLTQETWLYRRELQSLQSFRACLKSGLRLTEKQTARIERIETLLQHRRGARLVQGGAPGLGRR
jgi:hypothetical protein